MKKTLKKPLISVVMPVFNAADFLVEAVESILHQSYTNFEFIIIDDASTDNSYSILKEFAKKDKRIRLYKNRQKKTISETVSTAISKAKGTYLARMDADDISHTQRLEKQLRYLQKNPKTIAVGTQCITIDKFGRIIGRKKFPEKFSQLYHYSFRFTPIQQPSLMIAAHKLPSDFIYYDNKINAVEELKLIFKLFQFGHVENLGEYLLMYRYHDKNTSFQNLKKEFYLTIKARFDAVNAYHYSLRFRDLFTTLIQAIIVFTLPSFLTLFLYKKIRRLGKKMYISKSTLKKFFVVQKDNIQLPANPLISVVMPVYNAEEYISEAIVSVLKQTYKNFELIIVDDASTDNSYRIIKDFANKDKRILALHLPKRVSTSETVNYAMQQTKGSFIARMDADDIMHEERLKKQLDHLMANPDVIAVGAQCLLINKLGNIIGEKKFPLNFEEIYRYSFRFTPMQQGTLMIASHKLPKELLLFREQLSDMEEIELFFSLFAHGKLENLPDYLLLYRFHDKNNSLQNPRKEFLITVLARFRAIIKYGYKPRIQDPFITLMQAAIVLCLPKQVVIYLYKKTRYKSKTSYQSKFSFKNIHPTLTPANI